MICILYLYYKYIIVLYRTSWTSGKLENFQIEWKQYKLIKYWEGTQFATNRRYPCQCCYITIFCVVQSLHVRCQTLQLHYEYLKTIFEQSILKENSKLNQGTLPTPTHMNVEWKYQFYLTNMERIFLTYFQLKISKILYSQIIFDMFCIYVSHWAWLT